jgi:hypothetical protein
MLLKSLPRDAQRIVVAIDIETTGGNVWTDACFAVGVALCYRRDNADAQPVTLFRQCFAHRLPANYEERWAKLGFEQSTWEEFWSKNTGVLAQLQADAAFSDQRTMTQALCDLLHLVEQECAARRVTYNIVFDTINFDPVWINTMLAHIGSPSLLYYRNKRYGLQSYDLDTYVEATLAATLKVPIDALDWATQVKPFKERLAARMNDNVKHTHSPEQDAEWIAHKFLLVHDTPATS